MECSNGVGFGVGEEAQEGDGRTAQMEAQLHLIITDFFFFWAADTSTTL